MYINNFEVSPLVAYKLVKARHLVACLLVVAVVGQRCQRGQHRDKSAAVHLLDQLTEVVLDLHQRPATHYVHGADVNDDLCHLGQLHEPQPLPCRIYRLSRDAQSRLQHLLVYGRRAASST